MVVWHGGISDELNSVVAEPQIRSMAPVPRFSTAEVAPPVEANNEAERGNDLTRELEPDRAWCHQ